MRKTGFHQSWLLALSLVGLTVASDLHAQDMAGAADHPLIPRMAGSTIHGFAASDFDVGSFVVEEPPESRKFSLVEPEGKRRRILYIAKPNDTPPTIQKNYEVALQDLGEVELVYECRNKACPAQFFATNLWNRDSMLPTENLQHPFYLLGFSHVFTLPTYQYVRVRSGQSLYHVAVLAAKIAAGNSNVEVRERTAVLVEIVEETEFSPTLEFVDAAEIENQIFKDGHVILYGIQFEHDKASLREESGPTLAEVVKALGADAGLSLYVVGHTDDVGALAYNQDLSLRRAQTVVKALIDAGIDGGRLTALGVGPAAPVGSNDTEEGKALNRRVELVKRIGGP